MASKKGFKFAAKKGTQITFSHLSETRGLFLQVSELFPDPSHLFTDIADLLLNFVLRGQKSFWDCGQNCCIYGILAFSHFVLEPAPLQNRWGGNMCWCEETLLLDFIPICWQFLSLVLPVLFSFIHAQEGAVENVGRLNAKILYLMQKMFLDSPDLQGSTLMLVYIPSEKREIRVKSLLLYLETKTRKQDLQTRNLYFKCWNASTSEQPKWTQMYGMWDRASFPFTYYKN